MIQTQNEAAKAWAGSTAAKMGLTEPANPQQEQELKKNKDNDDGKGTKRTRWHAIFTGSTTPEGEPSLERSTPEDNTAAKAAETPPDEAKTLKGTEKLVVVTPKMEKRK